MNKKLKIFLFQSLSLLAICLYPTNLVFAYAGGGGHGGGGGTGGGGSHFSSSRRITWSHDHWLIIGSFIIFIIAILFNITQSKIKVKTRYLTKDKQKAPRNLYIYGKPSDVRYSQEAVEILFLDIQEAWNCQNLERVEDLYSPKLFLKHKRRLLKLFKYDIVNHISQVKIDGLTNYSSEEGKNFSLEISFQAIDYNVTVSRPQKIYGSCEIPQKFKQRWHFIKDGINLKVSYIDEIELKTTRFQGKSAKKRLAKKIERQKYQ